MPETLFLGVKKNWTDTSNAAIYLDLEDAAAQGILIQEYITGQTSPSLEIQNNAGTTVYQILASADTANASVLTTATTTGNAYILTANSLTTGSGLSLNSSATAITTTGRLLEVFHTGATSTSGTVIEFKTSAADETILLELDASALTSGTVLDINSALVDTGTVIAIDSLDALTTGMGLNIESGATAITGVGRLLFVDHSGATSTTGVIAEVASDATDETVVCRVTATGLLALGTVLDVSGAAVTTGTLLAIADADALTTGGIANFVSDSADTTGRSLVTIHNDNTAAVGTIPLSITQDALVSTNFLHMMTLGTMQIWVSDQTTPNGALTATEGSLCLNASATGELFYNTDGSTTWATVT